MSSADANPLDQGRTDFDMTHSRGAQGAAARIERFGHTMNFITERICAALVAAMILVVWLGIFGRYFTAIGVTWTEELARYIMIWAALLAVPCCTYRREHIGLDLLFSKLPERHRRGARILLDLIGLSFFVFLAVYGTTMAKMGASQYATIFGMTMAIPFLSVPVSCALTVVQILVCISREWFGSAPLYLAAEGGR